MKTISPGFLGKLLGGARFKFIEICSEGIYITYKKEPAVVEYNNLLSIEVKSGLLWRSLEITSKDQGSIQLKGLPKLGSRSLEKTILEKKKQFYDTIKLLNENESRLREIDKWIIEREQGKYWVANHEIDRLRKRMFSLRQLFEIPPSFLTKNTELQKLLKTLPANDAEIENFRSEANRIFITEEMDRFKEYLDTIEANPLTETQRKAVVSHENSTLVIAGAGSGKTSVIVAKAGYLIKKRLCSPNQLLLIAFNKSAANEIQERIKNRIGVNVRATTFHELGLSIIARATGKKPSLAVTATDQKKLIEEIDSIIATLLSDRRYTKIVMDYFGSHLTPYMSESDFETLGDYYRYVKEQELRTIRGELVKSLEELEIANFLFFNGITYEYEKTYEIDTASEDYRQYEPDFYLPDYNIYLEHFGISRDGSTAPFVDQDEYHEGMEWKRKIHEQFGSTLLETYSYQKQEGNLSEKLNELLVEQGVTFRPLSPKEIEKVLGRDDHMSSFTTLVACFLKHFKGNGLTVDDVKKQAIARKINSPRLTAFLNIFSPIYDLYEHTLHENNVIDFDDMIVRATELVVDGQYTSPYTNILVDEFQDISQGRASLISAMVNQKTSHRLFCVGDDWQSIYRFAGSDISIMRNFESHFGYTQTIYLDKTFRFNNKIEKVASRFILQNPAQIPKKIKTLRKEENCRVFIHFPNINHHDLVIDALNMIFQENNDASVLFLGRYNRQQNNIDTKRIKREFPGLTVSFKSVHSSKGTEADYVIILGIDKGKYGFPSEIVDDPILDAVLSEPESYKHAEERRLFYVALTRARNAVHLISATESPSLFIRELMTPEYKVQIYGRPSAKPVNCPSCKSGEMILHNGPKGNFYECSNFPLCTFTADVCPSCGVGYLILTMKNYRCNNKGCDFNGIQCPQCKTGHLVRRKGKYKYFLGCSNYGKLGCDYTLKFDN